MKKVLALALALVMIFALCACGQTAAPAEAPAPAAEAPAPAAEAPAAETPSEPELDISERTIRLATTSKEGSVFVDDLHLFADLVNEKSGGKITVEVHAGSVLGDVAETLQSTQLGVLEMAITAPGNLAASGVTDFTAVTLPYVFRDSQHIINVIKGDVGAQLLASIQESGIGCVGIGIWDGGARHFFSNKPIRTLEDVAGMRLRCQQLDVDTDMALALGASPTPIAFSELYSAIETGVVDGAENPLSGICSGKYYEVCKYLTLDGHSAPPVVAVFSEIVWNTMSEDEHNIIFEAWNEATANNLETLENDQAKYVQEFIDNGGEVIELSNEEKARWQAAMQPVYDKYGSECADVIAAIVAVE